MGEWLWRDSCGLFGIHGDISSRVRREFKFDEPRDAGVGANRKGNKDPHAYLTYLGLHALQHRGQESAGIVTAQDGSLYVHKGLGHVADVFTPQLIERMPGKLAIGHVRYSTAGKKILFKDAQPFVMEYTRGGFAVAHNGNITNAYELREELEQEGAVFHTTSDTEIITHLVARAKKNDPIENLIWALTKLRGAFSLVILTEGLLIGVRDPNGFRPLVLGRIDNASVIASESCAFGLIKAEFVREIEPGEMIVVGPEGHKMLMSIRPFKRTSPTPCIFEFIYFARPDSVIFGQNVYQVRLKFGRRLAEEHPADADLVFGIPDSGVPAAIGYSEASGLPFQFGMIRSHYIGRTFIEPLPHMRHFAVRLKLNPISDVVKGKKVVVVDDSIVRATTIRRIVKMIRQAGAEEIHIRISSPPIRFPCFYGIDTPTKMELIASTHTVDEIR
ncbi:MAG TPA: amidophosphoribosyltransferase, partial [Proteobacteria bacterium]|nr:amidophosphoribosyltransferase [Pseudomonadota bacterium]